MRRWYEGRVLPSRLIAKSMYQKLKTAFCFRVLLMRAVRRWWCRIICALENVVPSMFLVQKTIFIHSVLIACPASSPWSAWTSTALALFQWSKKSWLWKSANVRLRRLKALWLDLYRQTCMQMYISTINLCKVPLKNLIVRICKWRKKPQTQQQNQSFHHTDTQKY